MTGDPRQRLLKWISANPGANLKEIAEFLGVTRTAAVYHARKLERNGDVRVVVAGRRRLHFPNHVSEREDDLLGLLRLERARQIVEAIRDDPTVSWGRLARRLGVTPRAIRWQIARLEDEGVLAINRSEDRRVVQMHPLVRRHLEQQTLAVEA